MQTGTATDSFWGFHSDTSIACWPPATFHSRTLIARELLAMLDSRSTISCYWPCNSCYHHRLEQTNSAHSRAVSWRKSTPGMCCIVEHMDPNSHWSRGTSTWWLRWLIGGFEVISNWYRMDGGKDAEFELGMLFLDLLCNIWMPNSQWWRISWLNLQWLFGSHSKTIRGPHENILDMNYGGYLWFCESGVYETGIEPQRRSCSSCNKQPACSPLNGLPMLRFLINNIVPAYNLRVVSLVEVGSQILDPGVSDWGYQKREFSLGKFLKDTPIPWISRLRGSVLCLLSIRQVLSSTYLFCLLTDESKIMEFIQEFNHEITLEISLGQVLHIITLKSTNCYSQY